jgi:hypothetical protein
MRTLAEHTHRATWRILRRHVLREGGQGAGQGRAPRELEHEGDGKQEVKGTEKEGVVTDSNAEEGKGCVS